MAKKILGIIWGVVLICVLVFSIAQFSEKQQTLQTSSTSSLSNKKIEWGIRRGKNHEQPDVGEENKRIINKYDGICMGNPELPYVYLTFDNGYEAGYTEKILNECGIDLKTRPEQLTIEDYIKLTHLSQRYVFKIIFCCNRSVFILI